MCADAHMLSGLQDFRTPGLQDSRSFRTPGLSSLSPSMHPDTHRRDDASENIKDEVPGVVGVVADVGLGHDLGGGELDDFVDSAEPFAGEDHEQERAEAGTLVGECGTETLPADPRGDTEAVGVDEVVVFDAAPVTAADEPVVIKDVGADVDEAAAHVREAPDGERPEARAREADARVRGSDHRADDDHDDDIKEELGVAAGEAVGGGGDGVEDREDGGPEDGAEEWFGCAVDGRVSF